VTLSYKYPHQVQWYHAWLWSNRWQLDYLLCKNAVNSSLSYKCI